MRPMPDAPTPSGESQLAPPCHSARMYVGKTRDYLELFDKHGGYLAEDVVGCLLLSVHLFRNDYMPKNRFATPDESALSLAAVFRDYWQHGRDLLVRAGWWPTIHVPDALGIAFQRFLGWQEEMFHRALGLGCERDESDRSLHVRSIWLNFCVANATSAKRVDVSLLHGDLRKALTEAGLRGADGRDVVPVKELRAEAALINLAAEASDAPLIYYDAKGRGRVSWRAAKDLHPNRGQRMPRVSARRRIGRLVHGRGAAGVDASPNQDELDRELLVQDAIRRDQEAADALQAIRDEGVDRETLLAGVRERVRERGPAAEAALAYLLPIQLGVGRELSRREACLTVSPPVTPDALRHQELWLVPLLATVAKALGPR